MNCEQLVDEYEAYALGVATDPERTEISAHLRRNCPQCTSGVRAAIATVSAIALAVKPTDPPKVLGRRIGSLVKPDAGRSWAATLMPWIAATAVAIALISVALPGRRGKVSSAKLDQALAILDDPETKDVSFGEPTARGRVFVSSNKGVVFIAAHLPALDSGKTFELWVIRKAGNPIPAGTFEAEKDSTAVYVREGNVDNAAAVAVTVEPSGGSALPTTKPFIVTKL